MRIYKFRCWENIRRKTVLWHLLCVWMCCLICAVLRSKPFVLLDACINATSCENVKEVLRHLGGRNYTVIVGIPEEKDYAGVVRSMKGMANRIILTRSGNPHYHFSQKQQETLAEEDIGTIWTDSVKQALTLAGSCPDPIVILGTTSVISEVEQIFQ